MSEPLNERDVVRACLSAMADGEATEGEMRQALQAWRDDEDCRANWHGYTLIGDAMRSDDLISAGGGHDAHFLSCLRARLADEPVVLAPMSPLGPQEVPGAASNVVPLRAGARWRRVLVSHRGWTASAAVAAGCVMAVGAAMVWRSPVPGVAPAGVELAQVQAVATPASMSEVAAVIPMQRNPQLDRYLMAHRQFAQGPALAAPGGIRQVALSPDGE
ncbi:sigma-E factor negative regulatory protein [Ideonella oryzae]|uniref:Sigma-E factor negative regulatory protein n=1 Tax=Ideonella oryzae TaxID=2937441 RepID=A0ABT1BHW1_9BURK|nr:sigma-E factor negative regulatory protein [Ideonella oryzae]MCO5975810.1 sigma-E factor negative regulatory protein [Ideonella oryzae]